MKDLKKSTTRKERFSNANIHAQSFNDIRTYDNKHYLESSNNKISDPHYSLLMGIKEDKGELNLYITTLH